MSMIIASFFLIGITLWIIYHALFQKNTHQTTNYNQDLLIRYKNAYQQQQALFAQQLAAYQIDQTQYDEQMALLGRDLLQKNQMLTHKTRPISRAFSLGLLSLMSLLIIATALYVWFERYQGVPYQFDRAQINLHEQVKNWQQTLTPAQLQANNNLEQLELPDDLLTNFGMTLSVLQQQQAREGYQDFIAISALARLFLQVNQLQPANLAYQKALLLKPTDYDTLSTLAQLNFLLNNGQLNTSSEQYFQTLIQFYPEDSNALVQYALALYQSGKVSESLALWTRLKTLYADQNDVIIEIDKTIAALKAQVNQRLIHVELTSELQLDREQYPHAKIYVYARQPQQQGPPILAKQLNVPDRFPITVTLSDQDRMLPNTPSIAQLSQLEIEARISMNGRPEADPEDYHSHPEIVTLDHHSIRLDLHEAH